MRKEKRKPKKRKFIGEFKEFALRGNVIDLAVGVIIGGAFQKIVNSLVDDIMMPLIGWLIGGLDFNDHFIALDGNYYATVELAKASGSGVFTYGAFISSILNFVFMAFIIFMMVKFINMVRNRNKEPEKEDPARKCDFCKQEVDAEATRCPHCTSEIPM